MKSLNATMPIRFAPKHQERGKLSFRFRSVLLSLGLTAIAFVALFHTSIMPAVATTMDLQLAQVQPRHYDMSVGLQSNQPLTYQAKLDNNAGYSLYARVMFAGARDGEPFTFVVNFGQVPAGPTPMQFSNWWPTPDDIGAYTVIAYAEYSTFPTGPWTTDTQNVIGISFVIVP